MALNKGKMVYKIEFFVAVVGTDVVDHDTGEEVVPEEDFGSRFSLAVEIYDTVAISGSGVVGGTVDEGLGTLGHQPGDFAVFRGEEGVEEEALADLPGAQYAHNNCVQVGVVLGQVLLEDLGGGRFVAVPAQSQHWQALVFCGQLVGVRACK